MKYNPIEQRIEELRHHPILGQVLAELPDDRREEILNCLVTSKKLYPLSSDREKQTFQMFGTAIIDHIFQIIDEVIDNLD